jgi:hypothetical protein
LQTKAVVKLITLFAACHPAAKKTYQQQPGMTTANYLSTSGELKSSIFDAGNNRTSIKKLNQKNHGKENCKESGKESCKETRS